MKTRNFISVILSTLGLCLLLTPHTLAEEFQIRGVSPVSKPDTEKVEYEVNGSPATLFLEKDILMGADHVKHARVTKMAGEVSHLVEVTLTDQGQKLFSDLTSKRINQQIALLADGKVLIAPQINAHIRGGSLRIDGGYTAEEAKAIALSIKRTNK